MVLAYEVCLLALSKKPASLRTHHLLGKTSGGASVQTYIHACTYRSTGSAGCCVPVCVTGRYRSLRSAGEPVKRIL